MATDPSGLVPPALLRHIHLLSNYQFPKLPQFNLELVVEYLIQAPRIVKEQAPMNWQFLTAPQDGDILLVWQPPQMGTQEASDGYVWADPESAFSSETRGYKIEMYVHKSGFRMPNEPMATHARRRLRLTPSQNPAPSLPQPDPSLWIVHYQQSEMQNHYPSRNIRISDQVRLSMSERMQLQRHGQLVRKEFMLRDSASWPTINLPGNPNSGYSQQPMGYPNDVMAHMNRNQQQAFIQQQQASVSQRNVGPSPAKRPRHGGPGHAHVSATAIPAPVVLQDSGNDDEDGTVGGDYMDYLTPRDISLHRYLQHHEWLEEILESPYDTNQIIPGDLGLGRKGELESLTRDFFEAPTTGTVKEQFRTLTDAPTHKEDGVTPRVGRLEAGKAEDFTKRATERVAEITAGIEKLRRQHARRVAKLNKGRAIKEATEHLRTTSLEILNGDSSKSGAEHDQKMHEYAQNAVSRQIAPVKDVDCVQRGGLEEKSEGRDMNDQDYDMVDNFNLEGAQSEALATTERQERTPTNNPSEIAGRPENPRRQLEFSEESGHGKGRSGKEHAQPGQPRETSTEDWIMVNKDGNSGPEVQDLGDMDNFVNDVAMQPSTDSPAQIGSGGEGPQGLQQSLEDAGNVSFEQGAVGDTAGNFETTDFGEGIDFGDLDTAGAELSGYGEGDDQVDTGTGQGAFEDAFQSTDAGAAPGNPASGI